jgi:hypothetical protein
MGARAELPPRRKNARRWGRKWAAENSAKGLIEGFNRSGLRGVDLAYGYGGNVVVFAADGRAGQAA